MTIVYVVRQSNSLLCEISRKCVNKRKLSSTIGITIVQAYMHKDKHTKKQSKLVSKIYEEITEVDRSTRVI